MLETLRKTFDDSILKALWGVLMALFNFVFGCNSEIVLIVFILVLIDVFTGVWYAIRTNSVTSRDFSRTPKKIFVYFLMIVVSRLVDKSIPFQLASPIMDTFIVTTEAISILENFAKLNFPVPLFLVKTLKTQQNKEK